MPNQLPAGWIETFPTIAGLGDLDQALVLLQNSAANYAGLTEQFMLKRMHLRRINGIYYFNLRVFLRKPDIAAFFFLRGRTNPVAYCLSPGAAPAVTANDVLAQLVAISGYMENERNALPTDVVSSTNPPVFTNQNLRDAFDNAVNGGLLVGQGTIMGAPGWPPFLYRWEMNLP
jgi:hypothetical protein